LKTNDEHCASTKTLGKKHCGRPIQRTGRNISKERASLIDTATREQFDHMREALASITLKAQGLQKRMQTAGLSDSWTHAAKSIQSVADYAIASVPGISQE